MKFSRTLSALIFGLSFAKANYVAGPAQGVFVWYAYCLDVLYTGDPTKTLIAPGCAEGLGRQCHFDELLQYLDESYHGNTAIGNNLAPDVDDACRQLWNNWFGSDMKPYKLFPSLFNRGDQGTFDTVFGRGGVLTRIQNLRSLLDAAGDNYSDLLNRIISSSDLMTLARENDQAAGALDAFRNYLTANGINDVDIKYKTIGQGSYFGEIDIIDSEATLAANAGLGMDFEMAMFHFDSLGFQLQTTNADPNSGAIRHARAAQSSRMINTMLRGPSGCRL